MLYRLLLDESHCTVPRSILVRLPIFSQGYFISNW